jgi:RNA polymerase sigma-70 factor (family 1)
MQQFTELQLKQLVEKVAESNENAFKKLFQLVYYKLLLFAFSIVHSKELAAEVVDDVMVKLWQKRTSLTQIQHIKSYLYTAVKNTALNYLSKKTQEELTNPFDFWQIQITDNISVDKLLITKELATTIHQAIQALPPKCKVVFKLIKEDGLSYKEVAEILNISTKTVDAQMVTAIKQIKAALAKHTVTMATAKSSSIKKN